MNKQNEPQSVEAVRCSSFVRMRATLLIPLHPSQRTAIFAIRAGLVAGNFSYNGYDCKLLQWFWRQVIQIWPSQRRLVIEFLEGLVRINRQREICSAQSGKVSDRIARHIFQRFDNGDDKCKRIAARGGQWPEKETSRGGVCESAFASMIEDALNAPNVHISGADK